ncbi:CHASE2 domain-containing protein [Candidatus Latescibacterota bacterium]
MAEKKGNIKKELLNKLFYALICVSVILVVNILNVFQIFDKTEFASRDLRFRIRGVQEAPDDIVIVAIDPQTLDMLGLIGMPPRDYHVPVIEHLFMAGAKAVLFDVEFFVYRGEIEPGNIAPSPSFTDSLFAESLFMYPETIIGRKIAISVEDATSQSAGESPLPPSLFQNQKQIAYVDMFQDSDSSIRRALPISYDMGDEEQWQYSFALRAAMYAMDADTAWVDPGGHKIYVGDRVIPLDDSNPPTMIINYYTDEDTFARENNYISYEQVMDPGEFGIQALMKAERFKDKVVLIGATFPESHDSKITPFYLGTSLFNPSEYLMYGVHVHKNIADTIISGQFIQPVRKWQFFFLVLFMSVLATVINYRFRGFIGLFLSVFLIIVYTGAALYLFINNRLLLPLVAPAYATVGINYISVVTYNYLMERKQKTMIKGMFSQYLPGSVVNELIQNPDMLSLGGEERVMSVIFSDVAGFTTISESLSPTGLVELLNEYLTAMSDVVFKYNGIIDKYEGDAIMAEFGAPLEDKDHALNACYTAIEMQEQLAVLREKLLSEGKAEIRARVGINSGPMVVGNMGSLMTFDYTVMGDNVNLSSRLEGANKEYGTYIMCSEATRKMVEHEIITRELDLLRVKGKTEGVLVHEVLQRKSTGLDEVKQKVVDIYLEGLAAYKERRWDDGIKLFSEAHSIDPEDSPSEVYKKRCEAFKAEPPPDDWDGIFTMRTK